MSKKPEREVPKTMPPPAPVAEIHSPPPAKDYDEAIAKLTREVEQLLKRVAKVEKRMGGA